MGEPPGSAVSGVNLPCKQLRTWKTSPRHGRVLPLPGTHFVVASGNLSRCLRHSNRSCKAGPSSPAGALAPPRP